MIPYDKYSMARFITELHMPKELRDYQKTYHELSKAFPPREGEDYISSPHTMGIHQLHGRAHDFLSKYGFNQVGSGVFGTVFINPKYPYALKVFYADNAYLSWLKFCKRNQDNPYIPKLRKNFIRVIPTSNSIYAVRMEKLSEVKDLKQMKDMLLELEGMITSNANKNSSMITHRKKYDEWVKDKDKNLLEIAEFLYNNDGVLFSKIDLHPGNIMQRDNGQLVIIDPVAFAPPS